LPLESDTILSLNMDEQISRLRESFSN
jgi:hypothetical protein